jgi:hypothetical protein
MLKNQSGQLESIKQGKFLFDHIWIHDYTAVDKVFNKYNLYGWNLLGKDAWGPFFVDLAAARPDLGLKPEDPTACAEWFKPMNKHWSQSVKREEILRHIKPLPPKTVTKVTRIFTASKDGWHSIRFRRFCHNKGPTLSLIRSSENFLSAGFTSRSWLPFLFGEHTYTRDSSAMVFALTNELQVFKTNYPIQAVRVEYSTWSGGPCF